MSSFDKIDGFLMEELDRLKNVDVTTDEGIAELDRADRIQGLCIAAVNNNNSKLSALKLIERTNKDVRFTHKMLLGDGDRDE